jgi:outer membrane protein assembly factor BamA
MVVSENLSKTQIMRINKWLLLTLVFTAALSQNQDTTALKKNIFQRTGITPIPVLSYNRSYGTSVGFLLNSFTVINPKDSISPSSRTGIGVGYTANKSWAGVAFQNLFLKEDKWRVSWMLGLGETNFQFFQELDDTGSGVFIDYSTTTKGISATVTYNIFNRVYTGLKYQYSKSSTAFDLENKPNQIAHLSGYGIPITFDNRNNIYNPSNGFLLNFVFNSNTKWLGSDFVFNSVSFSGNYYKRLNTKGVLASRYFLYSGLGNVPFVGQKVIGGKDLRGYTKGEHRSNSVTALQSEYRYNFHEKWGLVSFAGVGYAFKNNETKSSGLLPSAGAGLRFMAMPKQKMNIGFDLALGKNDAGVYFRIGESF